MLAYLSEFITSSYMQHLLIMVGITCILSQGFNLSFGLGRLFNLAHIAAYAVGGYTTALLATDYGVGFIPCILASMLLSAVFSLLVGAISLRLSQEYFAIGTIAFSSVITALLINWRTLTRGVLGIPGIPRPTIFGLDFYDTATFLLLVTVIAVIVQTVFAILFSSSFARALRAQGESELVAQALGIKSHLIKNISFILSAATAGLAGSFFSYYFSFIDPSSFSFSEMVFILTIAVVGRPGSYWGNIFASFFLVLLPEPLRFIEIDSSILGPMRQLLYASILFFAVWYKRKSLFPMERKI